MNAARGNGDPQGSASTEVADPADVKPNRQHMRSQMSTSRLLAAAAELFADRGYRQTTLADIGERAGYSHGLVTRRFGSKHGLVVALLDHMIDVWMKGSVEPAVAHETGIAGIRAFLAAFSANATANSSNLRALESLMFEGLWGEPEFKERLVVLQKNGQDMFRDLVQGGIKNGTVRPDADAEAIALMASTALRGTTYLWLLEEDYDISSALNAFGDVLEALLLPRD